MNHNQLQIYCNKNEFIFEYQIFADIPLSEYFQSLADYLKEMENVCLIETNDTVYLKKKLQKKVSNFNIKSFYSQIEIQLKFRREVKLKFSKKFFQTLLFSKITDHLNDVGDPTEISDLNLSRLYNLSLTQGLWQGNVKMIGENSSGITLTYDVSHQITSQLTVYEFMRREILKHQHSENCLDIVRQSFIGKTVMTRYNNKVYRIDEVDFSTNPRSSFISDDGDIISFAKYYRTKYGIDIRHLGQPILINRVKGPDLRNSTGYVHCLLPELCFPIYNEWNPFGSDVYDEFYECLKCTPMVKEILNEWDLSIESKVFNTPKPIFLFETTKNDETAEQKKKKSSWKVLNIFNR